MVSTLSWRLLLLAITSVHLTDAFVPRDSKAPFGIESLPLSSFRDASNSTIERLLDWAEKNGVYLSNDIELTRDPLTGNMGVSERRRVRPNDVVILGMQKRLMEIPPELVLSSEMVNETMHTHAKEVFVRKHYPEEHLSKVVSQFCLFLVILEEKGKGEESRWYEYLQTLPNAFQTGLDWDEEEREYAKKLGLMGTLKRLEEIFELFQTVLNNLIPHTYDSEMIRWAFTVSFTRAWRANYKNEYGDSVCILVCFGDLFNHLRSEDCVILKQESADSPVVILQYRLSPSEELYMNYGNHTVFQYPVKYGFVDKSLLQLPLMPIINEFKYWVDSGGYTGPLDVSFLDSERMVFNVHDGSISQDLYDAALLMYLTYENTETPSDELKNDKMFVAASMIPEFGPISEGRLNPIRSKHRHGVAKELLRFVEPYLSGPYGPILDVDEAFLKQHPSWPMLRQFHEYLRGAYERLKSKLQEMAATECQVTWDDEEADDTLTK